MARSASALCGTDAEALFALLDAPPGDNPKLRKLMEAKPPWES